jgi:hypothetical protein
VRTRGRSLLVIKEVDEGTVETLPGGWARAGSRPIELVFRTVGERTSELALALALAHIQPHRAHVIRNVRPLALAVQRMLEIDHHCSHVVYVDADCLILEDMRPFLDANELAYVDCYVRDRFRGRTNSGVHITRIDVVRAMRSIPEPIDELNYVLRNEAHLRRIALNQPGLRKQVKNFHILHDYFQRYTDIFAKYAYRELRCRTEFYKQRLEVAMSDWAEGPDFDVARHAVRYAASTVPPDATVEQIERYIRSLPDIAQVEVQKLGFDLRQSDQVSLEEVERAVAADPITLGPLPKRFKVFGVGLSRTGTRSLTEALHVLGFDTVHYPTDRATLDTLIRGDARFPLLEHYDGITDITVAPYYEDLDHAWPGSKFVLTVRDEDSWLRSCHNHWTNPWAYKKEGKGKEHQVYMDTQRFLEAAVYASYKFNEDRFRRAYHRHVDNVTRYFTGRQGDLLVLDIVAGNGYEQLAPFLDVPVPHQLFPRSGRV